MTDEVDFAQGNIEAHIDRVVAGRKMFDAESLHECEDCGIEIPMQRRALGGVKYCIDCQEFYEKRGLA